MTDTARASLPSSAGYAGTAVVTAIVGVVFLMLGWAFGEWVMTPTGNPYSINWISGPMEGRPVAYFELTGGTAWRDFGEFATGILLLLEATFYGVLVIRPALDRVVLMGILGLAAAGCAANGLAAAMQVQAGFNSPIYAILGLAVCAVSAMSAWQRLRGGETTAIL
ncbi:MAG: hypothetical protein JWM57_430 [Phycisphaerales bacterium]|nr:hypothetical protein [Phycisphaerales bacterium]